MTEISDLLKTGFMSEKALKEIEKAGFSIYATPNVLYFKKGRVKMRMSYNEKEQVYVMSVSSLRSDVVKNILSIAKYYKHK